MGRSMKVESIIERRDNGQKCDQWSYALRERRAFREVKGDHGVLMSVEKRILSCMR